MRCREVFIRCFDIPLVRALRIQGSEVLSRRGVYLVVKDELGHQGVGECAPLPGLSAESFDQAHAQLRTLAGQLGQGPLPEPDRTDDPGDLFPSVRLALDMVQTDLAWQRSQPFPENGRASVPLNGLIMGQGRGLEASITTLLDQGYTSIKIKVARQPLARDIETVTWVRSLVAGRASLRLDANQTWSLDQACAFARAVGPESIEYIEEPTQTPQDHQSFWQQTGMPVAWDESLHRGEPTTGLSVEGIGAFVLKPALLGGLSRVNRLVDRARQLNIPVVLSSIFESPIALRFYAGFAIAHGLERPAHGLDTWRWLQLRREELPFRVDRGHLIL